jgi:nickel transport system ATP-binding protein
MSCFDSVFKIKHHFKETLASHKRGDQKHYLKHSRDALHQVGFNNADEILELYPFQMSGGMLQRVMVALALMMKASILIADEPTTDLDVVSQSHILELLMEMRARYGMSILLITHDLSVIAKMADKVAVMANGSILETAPVDTLFHQPAQQYTRALLKAHLSLYDSSLCKLLGFKSEHADLTRSLAN